MFDIANAAVRVLQADSLLQKDFDFALGLVSDFSGKLVKGCYSMFKNTSFSMSQGTHSCDGLFSSMHIASRSGPCL